MSDLPKTQHAVQLVAANELVLNKSKPIASPGRHQILCRVEAVGLCFSDLKLIKQFAAHPRKMEIVSGITPAILGEISSYVPGDKPTVPGHETVVRVEAVGEGVTKFKPGERFLVETDYRWLPTPESNGAFGYNFEGALQEYVLMDERVITSPQGESMLIPAPEKLSASAVALIEPWGCVENAYDSDETQRIEPDNTMLIVADVIVTPNDLTELFKQWGQPAKVIWASQYRPPEVPGVNMELCPEIARLTDASFDDVIYLGANPDRVEALFSKVGPQGLFNIVLCGERFGRDVAVPIGRVHYAGIRITGAVGYEPADSMKHIPQTSEVRKGDKINIVGAAGPMGTMHVIRNIYSGIEGISISAGDSDDSRLATLLKIAEPMATAKNVPYKQYSPVKDKMPEGTDYIVIMAPAPELAAAAVLSAGKRAIINVFAGIPATMTAKINLDAYIEKQMYFVGTSGSVLQDMKRELAELEAGRLDTNISVAAVCGLDGACDGIHAIENRSIAGKIIVYPVCKGLALTPIAKLADKLPEVAACLSNGIWTAQAEQKLLERYAASPAPNG
ncbi:MAG: alcohol dehydrogenase catalytic domain-containing protein [Sedimentisphaerales bacterium]|jgi:threonine dehydrogenase-like Zn-dependent dehydrogenase